MVKWGGVIPLGYKTGNSLRCWSEYFKNAKIYGIDIYDCSQVNTETITTFIADQSNNNQLQNVINNINDSIDIIIDDGSHNGIHQVSSFMFLNKFLSQNGIYVIEDVQSNNIEGFSDLSIFPKEYRQYILENFRVNIFDTRNILNRPDDFMIAFSKK
jgi:23S rRNA U2552 (ribose-2'-O)-methylase RlmE/FtsJ